MVYRSCVILMDVTMNVILLLVMGLKMVRITTQLESSCGSPPCGLGSLRNSPLEPLLSNYDNLMLPNFQTSEVTNVTCNVYVNSFDSINVETMDFQINVYLRQSWVDKRLSFNDSLSSKERISVDNKMAHCIWLPDTFFPNEKYSHQHCDTVPNRALRIHRNGSVHLSLRLSLRLSCPMSLEKFPFDRQVCYMKMESYGYTSDQINIRWTPKNAVQVNEELELPQFTFEDYTTGTCESSYITGKYSCIQIAFILRRQFGYYMVQNYLPGSLIVLLSWVSFWINIDSIPARISLGVLTALTITTQSVGVWMSLPRVSYVKAIDIWMSACVIFVFSASLEFALVNTMSRKEIRRMSIRMRSQSNDKDVPTDSIKRMADEHAYGITKHYDPHSRQLARKVDKISRRLFPIVYIIFNIVYWCYYLVSS
ncbi:unnamed protein product [Owenia fusiformis]|uniref:Uncharacterized protein n=1 Tax=Owenia fusiformis TaxID=6347 RepID=A0A8J1TIT8_OWEFU|nr:unnamed protein product [Owenia fusiformis]